jgi:hypothetical protein
MRCRIYGLLRQRHPAMSCFGEAGPQAAASRSRVQVKASGVRLGSAPIGGPSIGLCRSGARPCNEIVVGAGACVATMLSVTSGRWGRLVREVEVPCSGPTSRRCQPM